MGFARILRISRSIICEIDDSWNLSRFFMTLYVSVLFIIFKGCSWNRVVTYVRIIVGRAVLTTVVVLK